MAHKSGFVNIIGNPNVGKSSLLNALIGQKLAIINHKAQTTRHRIFGIYNTDDYQIVFSDTPGVIKPAYKMQENMMTFVHEALKDADVFLFMAELGDRKFKDQNILEKLRNTEVPVMVAINKIDLGDQEDLDEDMEFWSESLPGAKRIFPISVKESFNVDSLFGAIKGEIPEGPEWFPKDQLTDKDERFVVSEIIREKILTHYQQEIPYSVQVEVESFKEEETIIRIRALIFVARDTQKSIIIGKGGVAIKRVGTEARKDMERFFGKKIFLETFVKVDKDWRNDGRKLKKYGY
ncbi:MAG: GTPase Era [Flavobacteriales bacterium]|jgi:GTP-binding protein Era|nr:GTPase Era [Flavobacteriales bacterium]MBT3962662.1 GTPase Era [Flavobacteriales bacterium]MBT4705060.1 GTPase Era [Flavobacteriales bacterium]MBT4930080.1 GTPase Era [Flavobacteriales bacterium]MBT5133038.1 GTPase Era [Flavobacteriales bacterium]